MRFPHGRSVVKWAHLGSNQERSPDGGDAPTTDDLGSRVTDVLPRLLG
jgi:hypothetical protein